MEKAFVKLVPFLSKESGTGIGGAISISTGADGLSRNLFGGRLGLVGNWLLVCVGLVNVLCVSMRSMEAKLREG